MIRRRCLVIAAMALVAPLLLVGGPVDPYHKPYNRFAKSMAKWVKRILAISPSSLNFREVAAESWYEFQVGELFREFEQVVSDWRRSN
jgi:hypothetical protein